MSPEIRELGPEQLKALTHPLRVRMLRELRANGAATATLLAARLGESSGVTSYHLRQLEKSGFVEDAPDVGNGRERWWRAAFAGHHVATERWLDDPESAAVLATYQSQVVESHARAAAEWVATESDWDTEWVEASVLNDYRLRLTPAQLKRLTDVLHETVESFVGSPEGDGTEEAVVVLHAFPRRVRPFAEKP